MHRLNHPNVIKIFEAFESTSALYLVMEYCTGGDLYKKLFYSYQTISEEKSRKIMKRLFQAINHCHNHGIVHRDLKPENIMLKSDEDEMDASTIKIIDFGLCKILPFNNKLNKYVDGNISGIVGTTYYTAPEVLEENHEYGMACDYWSLGVILYVLLSGHLPFPGKTHEEVEISIRSREIDFSHVEFKTISDDGKDLILRLLNYNPEKRFNCI